MLQYLKDPKILIPVIVLVLATLIFFYSKATGPKVATAVAKSAALQQGANNMVLSDDKGNLSQIAFPKGIIVAWSGPQDQIPKPASGWALCDGQNGTPDLRGRFLVGINPDLGKNESFSKYDMGNTGGSEKIEIKHMPSHTHRYKDTIAMEHDSVFQGYENFGGGNGQPGLSDTDNDNSAMGITRTTDPTGSGEKFSPPYYAVAYIMKL